MAVTRKRVPATCLECGREFMARKHDVERGFGTTCSLACRNKRGIREARKIFQVRSSPKRRASQIRASGLINMRIRRGQLARPDHCSNCGKVGKVDAHHDDYTKPDQVVWLCRSCHMKRHFGNGQKATVT